MSTIVTRSGKGSPLTHVEVDANFTNLNSDKTDNATAAITGGTINGATVGATTPAAGTFTTLTATGQTSLGGAAGSESLRAAVPGSTGNYWQFSGSSGAIRVDYQGSSAGIDGIFVSRGTGAHRFSTSTSASNEQMRVSHTASAVNYVQVTGGATGAAPSVTAQGSDSFIGLNLQAKSATLSLGTRVGGSATLQIVDSGASPINFLRMVGAATNVAPVLSAQGSDTNIPLVLQPKNTGALQAQQTDSTATGGNARGANAVDWQTARDAASRVASGQYSVVTGGYANTASGTASLSGGFLNNNSGNFSFIGGGAGQNLAGSYSVIAGGWANTASGFINFIGGGYGNSGTSGSAVTTQSGTMNATTAVTLSGSNANIKVGQYISGTSISNGTYVAAISGTSLTLSQAASGSSTSTLSFFTPHGVVVGGGNNQATGSYSFIGGGGDAGTAANRNVASGDWSTVGGGIKNTATANGAVIVGGGVSSISGAISGNSASGVSSFIGGGYQNNVSGGSSVIVGGSVNTATGSISTIVGGRYGNDRGLSGVIVFPACISPIASSSGVSQSSLFVLGKQTTDATATVLTIDGGGPVTTNQVIMPNNSAYYFRGTVVAGVTGGGNTKGWTIEGVIKRGANAASTTVVGVTVASMYADAGAVTWTIAAAADTTNGGLAITFTGQAATTIRCVAKIETTEMTY